MVRSLALIAFLASLTPPVSAQDAKAVAALTQGGFVIVFRHGATNRDMADTDPLNVDDPNNVSKQRQLSERGRQVARDIGGAFKTLQIPVGAVYTSRFFRAIETGRLISGKDVVTTADVSEGGQVVTPIENDRRTEAMRKLAATVPARGTNTLVVSHKPNILDAFGKDWFDVREGEASIFKPDGSGKFVLVGRVQASDWSELAKRR
ncbi:MAG TPA: histidine phosphatase family protein [Burkholderiales bacterium]|nr:histidine phosphatase family protein [Burkholderiales bacterium]